MRTYKLTIDVLKKNRVESWFHFYKKFMVRSLMQLPTEKASLEDCNVELHGEIYTIKFQELYANIFLELVAMLPDKKDVDIIFDSINSTFKGPERHEEQRKTFNKILNLSMV